MRIFQMDNRQTVIRKAISLGLMILSLIMLLCPWTALSTGEGDNQISLPDAIQRLLAVQPGFDEEELKTALAEQIRGIMLFSEDPDTSWRIMDALDRIWDGAATPLEMAQNGSLFDELAQNVIKETDETGGLTNFAVWAKAQNTALSGTILWILLLLELLALVYGVFCLLRGGKIGLYVYGGVTAVVFLVLVITPGREMQPFAELTMGLLLPGLFKFEILPYTKMLHAGSYALTAAPFICLLAAIAAVVLDQTRLFWREELTAAPVAEEKTIEPMWTCRCGTKNDIEGQFCTICGTRRNAEKPQVEEKKAFATLGAKETSQDRIGSSIKEGYRQKPETEKTDGTSAQDQSSVWSTLGDL